MKFCVVTGTRAEYSLLKPLLAEVAADPQLELQVLVTGSHLAKEYGETWKQIETDGFHINAQVDIELGDDSPLGIARSLSLAVSRISEALNQLNPAVVVILGDRYEILAVAQSCLILRIPLAHIHGGEATEGAIDDSIRHAVTKMAHLHFVAAEPYRRRVIQLGEHPDRVWNVGAVGLEAIQRTEPMSPADFEKHFGFRFASPSLLITFHPATLDLIPVEEQCDELLKALDEFPTASILFTQANADTGGRIVNQKITDYVNRRAQQAQTVLVSSLGPAGYYHALQNCDVVVGNSSSGIIEAPYFRKPAVNIGVRQKGRLMADSVIQASSQARSIANAILQALSPEFQKKLQNFKNPYGEGHSAKQIRDRIKQALLQPRQKILLKSFYDLPTP